MKNILKSQFDAVTQILTSEINLTKFAS